jgi:hypothetical protein
MINDVILVSQLLGMTANVRNASLFRLRKMKKSLKHFFLPYFGSDVPVV